MCQPARGDQTRRKLAEMLICQRLRDRNLPGLR